MKLRICKPVLRNKNYYYCKCNFRKNRNFSINIPKIKKFQITKCIFVSNFKHAVHFSLGSVKK